MSSSSLLSKVIKSNREYSLSEIITATLFGIGFGFGFAYKINQFINARKLVTNLRKENEITETENNNNLIAKEHLVSSDQILPQAYQLNKSNFSLFSEIFILGSGSSMGVPRTICVANPMLSPCKNCPISISHGPLNNPYYRGNPSMVIRYRPDPKQNPDNYFHILVDCGKTWREAAIRYFPIFGVNTIDSIILTHEHADAILGLDDIRTMQHFQKSPQGADILPPSMPIYSSKFTADSIKSRFPYLAPNHMDSQSVIRRVSALTFHTLPTINDYFQTDNNNNTQNDSKSINENVFKGTMYIHGLPVTSFNVMHGADYISLGFVFGSLTDKSLERLVYISDISSFPKESWEFLLTLPSIDLLIIDSLFIDRPHNTHINMKEAIEYIRILKPIKSLLIGMTDEFEHFEMNNRLAELKKDNGLDIQLSHDGMFRTIKLA